MRLWQPGDAERFDQMLEREIVIFTRKTWRSILHFFLSSEIIAKVLPGMYVKNFIGKKSVN